MSNKLHVYAKDSTNVMSDSDNFTDYERGAKAGDSLSSKTLNTAIRAATLIAKCLIDALTAQQTSDISCETPESDVINWITTGLKSIKCDKAVAADKMNMSKTGGTNKGVYVSDDGTIKAMAYEVNKTVPENAAFTDTVTKVKVTSNQNEVTLNGTLKSGDVVMGDAATKTTSDSVSQNGTGLPTEKAVYNAIPKAYRHRLAIDNVVFTKDNIEYAGNFSIDCISSTSSKMNLTSFIANEKSSRNYTSIPNMGKARLSPASGVFVGRQNGSYVFTAFISSIAIIGENDDLYICGTSTGSGTIFLKLPADITSNDTILSI